MTEKHYPDPPQKHLDALLDHIYEHGTTSEGVLKRVESMLHSYADATCALRAAPPQEAAPSQDAEDTARLDWKEVGRQAVRWAPSSAYWSAELKRLFGPDAREGINVLEARLRDFEVDAERYRWLRDKSRVFKQDPDMSGNHYWMIQSNGLLRGATLDAAIDHARRAEGGGE
ncbi:MAG: hypothetical protein RBU21_02910 [FCB group bacterium]|jgi:hypothetical protein|nr:hypothetical protein [FCB group bacterium]